MSQRERRVTCSNVAFMPKTYACTLMRFTTLALYNQSVCLGISEKPLFAIDMGVYVLMRYEYYILYTYTKKFIYIYIIFSYI